VTQFLAGLTVLIIGVVLGFILGVYAVDKSNEEE